MPKMPMMSFD